MSATLIPHRTRPERLSVPTARRLAFAGGLWAFGFAAVHAYWAAATITGRPVFLAYDLVACAVLFLAGIVGWVLSVPAGGGRWRLFLVHLAFVGGIVALARGTLGLLQDATLVATGSGPTVIGVLCDAWFTVAGVVFVVAGRRLAPTARVVTGFRR